MLSWRTLVSVDNDADREVVTFRDFIPATVLLCASAFGLFAASFIPSAERGAYAVMAPLSYNLAQTAELVARAGGDIVDIGGLTNVLIVHSSNPDFAKTAYRAGALLVIGRADLGGCGDAADGRASSI